MKNKIKKTNADKLFMAIIFILITTLSILIILPLIWVLLTSFNDFYSYLINPLSFPKNFQFSNYVKAFNGLSVDIWDNDAGKIINYNIYNMFGYSVIIAGISAFLGVLSPALLGYATAKYEFPGNNLLISINIFVMTLPIYGALPSKLLLFKTLGLYDNLIPFLLVGHTGFGMSFLIFRSAFKAMPREYKEVASIDGAGHFTIMMIYVRLLMPLFIAYLMLGFVGNWNDYMTNVIWLPSYPNLAYGIYVFQNNATIYGFTVPEILAGFIIVAIPAVILWTVAQKFVGDRIVAGSFKG